MGLCDIISWIRFFNKEKKKNKEKQLTNWLSPEAVPLFIRFAYCLPLLHVRFRGAISPWRLVPSRGEFSALVHLPTAWSLGRRKFGWIPPTSPLRFRRKWGPMRSGRRIRLTSCSWCAARWVWHQQDQYTKWHGGWWVSFNWRARAPQAAPERLLLGAMLAPGRPRQLRWPVPAVPPPVAPPMVPPFQFARLGLAADVPEEVIQPFHDLAQEVVPLRGDELTSFFRDAIRREAIAMRRPGPYRRRRALPPLSRRPPSSLRRLPRPPPQSTSPPHLPRFSLTPASPPPSSRSYAQVCTLIFSLFCTLARAAARHSTRNRSCNPWPRKALPWTLRWPRGSAAPAYRITSRDPRHGSCISKRPSGTTRICFPT